MAYNAKFIFLGYYLDLNGPKSREEGKIGQISQVLETKS